MKYILHHVNNWKLQIINIWIKTLSLWKYFAVQVVLEKVSRTWFGISNILVKNKVESICLQSDPSSHLYGSPLWLNFSLQGLLGHVMTNISVTSEGGHETWLTGVDQVEIFLILPKLRRFSKSIGKKYFPLLRS